MKMLRLAAEISIKYFFIPRLNYHEAILAKKRVKMEFYLYKIYLAFIY